MTEWSRALPLKCSFGRNRNVHRHARKSSRESLNTPALNAAVLTTTFPQCEERVRLSPSLKCCCFFITHIENVPLSWYPPLTASYDSVHPPPKLLSRNINLLLNGFLTTVSLWGFSGDPTLWPETQPILILLLISPSTPLLLFLTACTHFLNAQKMARQVDSMVRSVF